MPSLQKPKKIVFRGTDGKMYPMLCKPHDDLRKDARLMDFNSMINKLLKSASESRRRQLCESTCREDEKDHNLMADIRTYAVMPLNEECGLLEWVSNTNALKRILEKEYARQGKKIYVSRIVPRIWPLLELITSPTSCMSRWILPKEPDLRPRSRLSRKKCCQCQSIVADWRERANFRFSPSVFHNWFLTTWPEPTAWLASRMAYSRTLAVMSMIGHVLG